MSSDERVQTHAFCFGSFDETRMKRSRHTLPPLAARFGRRAGSRYSIAELRQDFEVSPESLPTVTDSFLRRFTVGYTSGQVGKGDEEASAFIR
jgi:hypothetical protein